MTLLFIKKTDYLVKSTKDIAIQQQEYKQQLFGSPSTHVPHFKLQKYTQEWLIFIKSILLNPSLMMK